MNRRYLKGLNYLLQGLYLREISFLEKVFDLKAPKGGYGATRITF